MSTRQYFLEHTGDWMRFKAPWGTCRGMIEQVRDQWVLLKMPKEDAPFKSSKYREAVDIQFTGGPAGCWGPGPFWARGPWCWCWMPIIFIIVIVWIPFFCW